MPTYSLPPPSQQIRELERQLAEKHAKLEEKEGQLAQERKRLQEQDLLINRLQDNSTLCVARSADALNFGFSY